MKYKLLFTGILLFFIINLASATTMQLSNTSSEYLLCIYEASGQFKGCANSTNAVNISRSDWIFELTYPERDLMNRPQDLFGYFVPLIFIVILLILIIFIGLAVTGGFGKLLR